MRSLILICVLSCSITLFAQQRPASPSDPCGLPDITSPEYKAAASGNWGYGYDTLRIDLARWQKSPFIKLDSIGASVQQRTLYMLTISDTTADTANVRKRIWIHARTHPDEVQGTWVTNEMIGALLYDTLLGPKLRKKYVFNIVPMYNPDGIELKFDRENANGIDIESNWDAASPQPEVLVLRSMFEKLMAKPNPIRLALNMHSSVSGVRYFVYHTVAGTSARYSALEIKFINQVRGHFPGGIQPYTYFVSWTGAPATQYPESWFWFHAHDSVMALTYEDVNGSAARAFDSTARALLQGADDFLSDTTAVTSAHGRVIAVNGFVLDQNYPNPFNPFTNIGYYIPARSHVSLSVFNTLGQKVAELVNEDEVAGSYEVTFDASGLASGMYLYRMQAGSFVQTRKLVVMK